MNVFVLCTGRCGSVTFARAAGHASNFTAGHETRTHLTGAARFAYPASHIEADNRLSWLLGRLDRHHGDEAFYVHLRRDVTATAQSFLKRFDKGIIDAYYKSILMGARSRNKETLPLDFCIDYCNTINDNIALFLRDKTRKMDFALETALEDFPAFWDRIGAEGDFDAAMGEWAVRHNASQ